MSADEQFNLPKLCSKTDNGTGVSVGECFAIYTATASPRTYANQEALDQKANQIKDVLEIIATEADLKGREIRAIRCERAGSRPAFLLSAREAKKHCIVGNGSATECLLAALQRPWCLLEMCCFQNKLVIQLLVDLATLAARVSDHKLPFEGAVILLSHELNLRNRRTTGEDLRSVNFMPPTSDSGKFGTLSRLSVSLFGQTEKSYRKDILRMLYVCACYFGVSIRDMLAVPLWNSNFASVSRPVQASIAPLPESLLPKAEPNGTHTSRDIKASSNLKDMFKSIVLQMNQITME